MAEFVPEVTAVVAAFLRRAVVTEDANAVELPADGADVEFIGASASTGAGACSAIADHAHGQAGHLLDVLLVPLADGGGAVCSLGKPQNSRRSHRDPFRCSCWLCRKVRAYFVCKHDNNYTLIIM